WHHDDELRIRHHPIVFTPLCHVPAPRMERAGRPRHRSHNLRGEGERAGRERINPSCGGSTEAETSLTIAWFVPRSLSSHFRFVFLLPTSYFPGLRLF